MVGAGITNDEVDLVDRVLDVDADLVLRDGLAVEAVAVVDSHDRFLCVSSAPNVSQHVKESRTMLRSSHQLRYSMRPRPSVLAYPQSPMRPGRFSSLIQSFQNAIQQHERPGNIRSDSVGPVPEGRNALSPEKKVCDYDKLFLHCPIYSTHSMLFLRGIKSGSG